MTTMTVWDSGKSIMGGTLYFGFDYSVVTDNDKVGVTIGPVKAKYVNDDTTQKLRLSYIPVNIGSLGIENGNVSNPTRACVITDTDIKAGQTKALISETYSFSLIKTHQTYTSKLFASQYLNVYRYSSDYESNRNFYASCQLSVHALSSYYVTFNANGGSGAPASQTKWYGETLALSSTIPTRAGYTFAGWNTASNGSGTNYGAGANYTANAAVTLYAKWTPNKYGIAFNANGGTGSMGTISNVSYDQSQTLASVGFSRTGYSFAGWATSASGNVAYANGASVRNLTTTNGATVTLYAKWTPKSYSVKFNARYPAKVTSLALSHGVDSYTQTGFAYDANKNLESTSSMNMNCAEYAFAGWSRTEGGAATIKDGESVKNLATEGTANLFATWTCTHKAPSITSVTVKRVGNDGTDDDGGTRMRVIASAKNTGSWTGGTFTIQVKEHATSSWASPASPQTTGSGAIVSYDIILGDYDINKSYDVRLTFEDAFGSTATVTDILTQGFFTLDVLADGKGVSVGGPATREGFDVAMRMFGQVDVLSSLDLHCVGKSNFYECSRKPSQSEVSQAVHDGHISAPFYLLVPSGNDMGIYYEDGVGI